MLRIAVINVPPCIPQWFQFGVRRAGQASIIRTWMVAVLVLAIALSPRIPLPVPIPGRTLDLRVEDVLLVLFLLSWITYSLWRPSRIYLTPLGMPLAVYFLVAAVAAGIGLSAADASPLRVFFYLMKKLEYFLLFFLIANLVRSGRELERAVSVLFLSGLLNAAWAIGQLGGVIWLGLRVVRRSRIPEGRAVAAATVSATAGMAVAALFQDAFTPVVLNELWWVLVGLTAATHRLERMREVVGT